jgi:uncharacterized RDD family membrane protein YckC
MADADLKEPAEPTRVIGRRCVQSALDKLLVALVSLAVFIVTAVPVIAAQRGDASRWVLLIPMAAFLLSAFVLGLANEVWLAGRWGGATLGMRMLGLRVVTAQGAPPTARTLAIRWLLWVADGLFFGLAGVGVMLGSRYQQRLGDMVAGTYVVRASAVARTTPTTQAPAAGAGAGPSPGPRSADEAALPGPHRDLGAVADSELALDSREMRLDRGQ